MTPPSGEGGGFEQRRRELLSSCENEACSVQILFQRSKDVIFEGLSEDGLVIVMENGEEDEGEEEEIQREVREFVSQRENEVL